MESSLRILELDMLRNQLLNIDLATGNQLHGEGVVAASISEAAFDR